MFDAHGFGNSTGSLHHLETGKGFAQEGKTVSCQTVEGRDGSAGKEGDIASLFEDVCHNFRP